MLHHVRPPLRCAALLAAVALFPSCAFLPYGRAVYTIDYPVNVSTPEFVRALTSVTGQDLTSGNRCRLLENGDQMFPAMLSAIRQAHSTINVEMYIFTSDATGVRFARAIEERARAGVTCRVLVDGWGSHNLSPVLEAEMKQAGVEFARFRPILLFHKFKNRTHRKILVVDGRTAFIGGEGFDDRWAGDADSPSHWHDVAVQVDGPVVAQFQRIFSQNWIHWKRSVPAGPGDYPALPPEGSDDAMALASSFGSRNSACALALGLMVHGACRRIWIESAYFIPSDSFVRELAEAGERGVDVQLVVPGRRIDTFFIRPVARATYGKLLKAGVRIYEYQPTMMHAKTMVIDSLWSTVGSINIDNRSFLLNDEANVSVRSAAFAQELETMFERDRAKSREVTLAEWQARSLWKRLSEAFWGLFEPEF